MGREMKDSSLVWIGDVPSNWQIRKVKHFYNMRTGFTPDTKVQEFYDEENGFDWINISDMVDGKTVYSSKKKISQKYLDIFHPEAAPAGSLLYSFKLSVGQTSFAGKDFYTNEAIACFLNSENVNLRYLRYSSAFIIENAQTNIYNAKILNQDLINNAYIPFPPLFEQALIANFLDKKCAEIDSVIEKTEKTIEEYKALKQSIITEAVTKGIRGDRPMKDSGIEWIGKIPEEWEIHQTKTIFSIYSGATPKSEMPEYWDGEVVWITPADFKTDDKYVSNGKRTLTVEGYNSCGTTITPSGSLIFTKRAPIGTVAISDVNLCTNQGCLSCVPKIGNVVEYFYYVMSIFSDQYNLFGTGTTFKEISFDSFASFKLPYPSIAEQHEISDYLSTQCTKIDTLIATKHQLLIELEKYKKSLIYEYVTGKKEVPVCQ